MMYSDDSSRYLNLQTITNKDNVSDKYNFLLEDQIFNSDFELRGRNSSKNIGDVLQALEYWRKHMSNISLIQECELSDFCSGKFRHVVEGYNNIHGYVSIMVCVFGSLANVLNVAVLTRRDMASAPINRLLKWLAVADVFVMLEYVPFAIYRYLVLPEQAQMPYPWAIYMLLHMHYTQILHTASIFLTLSLAVWRYIAIKYPTHSSTFCTDRRCSMAIIISFLLPPILCIPSYAVFTIHKTIQFDIKTMKVPIKLYFVDWNYQGRLYQINFWVHAVLFKLLPCVILTVISAWLIRALYRANNRKKALKGYSACATKAVANGNGVALNRVSTKRSKSEKRTDRTTRMLVAVLLLFLITEFPQGILGLLSGLLGRCFFRRCYELFGELMDFLALLNGAINFILYCSMSRQFRTTFGALIMRTRCSSAPRASSHTELQTTYV